ncbi:hypothetical protein Pr1d_09960 [Bythopirellula goksoeyrii]|uniref:Uncharacterized protein n=1 Tax=Bythopirellula goksoeyrii TaxID=1400387 RepID=A0A5B9QHN5_9BACT|nr:hypothetical protein Pr1d_09960 [Bythopirellula goksoeyrii]
MGSTREIQNYSLVQRCDPNSWGEWVNFVARRMRLAAVNIQGAFATRSPRIIGERDGVSLALHRKSNRRLKPVRNQKKIRNSHFSHL